jgi:hypothetical protein
MECRQKGRNIYVKFRTSTKSYNSNDCNEEIQKHGLALVYPLITELLKLKIFYSNGSLSPNKQELGIYQTTKRKTIFSL